MSVPYFAAGHLTESTITPERFESERLARRLAMLEASIAQSESALRDRIDPITGERLPAASGEHRAQLICNLAIEKSLVERIRALIASRS